MKDRRGETDISVKQSSRGDPKMATAGSPTRPIQNIYLTSNVRFEWKLRYFRHTMLFAPTICLRADYCQEENFCSKDLSLEHLRCL